MLRVQLCRSLINNTKSRSTTTIQRGISSSLLPAVSPSLLHNINTNSLTTCISRTTPTSISSREKDQNIRISNGLVTLNNNTKSSTFSTERTTTSSRTITHSLEEIKLLLNQEKYPIGKLPCDQVEKIFSRIEPSKVSQPNQEQYSNSTTTFQQRNQYVYYLRELWNRLYKEYKHDPTKSSTLTSSPIVLKNIIEYCIQVPNGIQAKKTFDDWFGVFGCNIEYHPDNHDMELVMYVFYMTSKKFHYQFCNDANTIKIDENQKKLYYNGYTTNMCLENIKQMHEFYINMKSLFDQGNIYIRPFDSYYLIRMLLVSWSHWAQILNHATSTNTDDEVQEIGGIDCQILKKEAAENAHALLKDLNIAEQKQSTIQLEYNEALESYLQQHHSDGNEISDTLSTFQCKGHVISSYIADGSKDAMNIAMNLLDNLEEEIITTSNSSFGPKEWETLSTIYHQLMKAYITKNINKPLKVESLFYRLVQIHQRLEQQQLVSLDWMLFWNVIESFYYYNKDDNIHVIRKVQTLLRDMEEHYVHVIQLDANLIFESIDNLLMKSSQQPGGITAAQALTLEVLVRFWLRYYSNTNTASSKNNNNNSNSRYEDREQRMLPLQINNLCNSTLQTLCQTKQIKQGQDFFTHLKTIPNDILTLNTSSYIPLIKYTPPEVGEMYLQEMDNQSLNTYIRPNRFCYTMLIQNYAKKGNVKDSLRIFNDFQKKSHSIEQTTSTSGTSNSSESSSLEDYTLDPYVYSSMLNALSSNMKLLQNTSTQEYLEYIWNTIPISQKNNYLYSIIMNLYAKISTKESAFKALKVLKHMETSYLSDMEVYPQPDVICYTNAIQALCYTDDDDDYDTTTTSYNSNNNNNTTATKNKRKDFDPAKIAEKLYMKLKHDYKISNNDPNLKPNTQTLTSLFNVWIKHNHLDQADYFLKQLTTKHMNKKRNNSNASTASLVLPNVYTFTMVLDAWSKSSDERREAGDKCEQILSLMENYFDLEEDGIPNFQHYTMTINAWSKSHSQDKAVRANEVLQRMKRRLMDDPYHDSPTASTTESHQLSRSSNSTIRTTPQETYAYTSLINACSTTSPKNPKNIQKQALQIAITSMKELRTSSPSKTFKPNHFTYVSYIRAIRNLSKYDGDYNNARRYYLLRNAFHDCCTDGLLHEKVIQSFYWACGGIRSDKDKGKTVFDELTKGYIVPATRAGHSFIIDYDSIDKDWIRNL